MRATSCGCGARPALSPSPSQPAGVFSLVDHHGRRVTQDSFGDKLLLVFFGFTNCKVVCPRALAGLSAALELLGDRAVRIQALYITVDPQRDTPTAMKAFLASHPAFLGLAGSDRDIEEAKKTFKVFAEKATDADAPGGYVVPHTAITYLAGPGGRYLGHFSDGLEPAEMAQRLTAHLEA